jgi:hypothetical protein
MKKGQANEPAPAFANEGHCTQEAANPANPKEESFDPRGPPGEQEESAWRLALATDSA